MKKKQQQITCGKCVSDRLTKCRHANIWDKHFFMITVHFICVCRMTDGQSCPGFSWWLLPECASVCFPSQWLLYPAALCFMVFAQWHIVSVSPEVLAQILYYLTGLQHTASFIMEISLSHHQQKPSVQSKEKVLDFSFTILTCVIQLVGWKHLGHDAILLRLLLRTVYKISS